MSVNHSASKQPGACVLQDFADSVSQMVTQKFRELTAGLTSTHARHRALAGIVMTKGNTSYFYVGFSSRGEEISVCLILGNKGFSLPSKALERKTKVDTEGSVMK